LENPYNIAKNLQKLSYDVKTDVQYPNSLRPDENNGYGTVYTDDTF